MITSFWLILWAGFLLLTVAAGVTIHARRGSSEARGRLRVDDDVIARIIETGEIFVDDDEPLDLRDIEDEEERFWSETWDEPSEDQ